MSLAPAASDDIGFYPSVALPGLSHPTQLPLKPASGKPDVSRQGSATPRLAPERAIGLEAVAYTKFIPRLTNRINKARFNVLARYSPIDYAKTVRSPIAPPEPGWVTCCSKDGRSFTPRGATYPLVVRDFNQVLVWVANVDRPHFSHCAVAFDRTFFDANFLFVQVANHFVERG